MGEIDQQLKEVTDDSEQRRALEQHREEIEGLVSSAEQLQVRLEEADLHKARRALQCIRTVVEASQL